MKDKKQELIQEERFISLRDDIVKQLDAIYPNEFVGGAACIAGVETDGGYLALYLDSMANWNGRIQMMGIPIGKNPDTESLLSMYSLVKNEKFRSLEINVSYDEGRLKQKEYIQSNKEKLFNGLLTDMETALKELQNNNSTQGI